MTKLKDNLDDLVKMKQDEIISEIKKSIKKGTKDVDSFLKSAQERISSEPQSNFYFLQLN